MTRASEIVALGIILAIVPVELLYLALFAGLGAGAWAAISEIRK